MPASRPPCWLTNVTMSRPLMAGPMLWSAEKPSPMMSVRRTVISTGLGPPSMGDSAHLPLQSSKPGLKDLPVSREPIQGPTGVASS